eukprot:jgi/Mesvir1/24376/Mv11046-RA.1
MAMPKLAGKPNEAEPPRLPRDDVNSPLLCLDSALAYVVRNATFFLEQPKFADSLMHWDVEVRRPGLTKYLLNHRFVYNLVNEIQLERGSAGLVMELTKAILNVDFTRSRRMGKGDTVVDVVNAVLSGDLPEYQCEDEDTPAVTSVVVDLIPFALLQLKSQGNGGPYKRHITENLVTLLTELWKRLSPDIPGMLELPGLLCAVDNVMTDWVRVPVAVLTERRHCVSAGLAVCRLYVRRMLELLPSLVTLPEYARIRTALVQVEKRVQVAGGQWTHLAATPHQSVLPAPMVHKKPRKSPMRVRLEDPIQSPADETLWDEHGNPVLDKCPSSPSILGPLPGWVRVSPGLVRPATEGYRNSTRPFTAMGRNGARAGAYGGLTSSPSQPSLGTSHSLRGKHARVDTGRWEPPLQVRPSLATTAAVSDVACSVESVAGSEVAGMGPDSGSDTAGDLASLRVDRHVGRPRPQHKHERTSSVKGASKAGGKGAGKGGDGQRGGGGSQPRAGGPDKRNRLLSARFSLTSDQLAATRPASVAGVVAGSNNNTTALLPSSPSSLSVAAGGGGMRSPAFLSAAPSFNSRASLEVLQASLQSHVAAIDAGEGGPPWDEYGGGSTGEITFRADELEEALGSARRGFKSGGPHGRQRSANGLSRRNARGEDELTDLEKRVAKLREDAEARAKERARAESRRRRKERLRQLDPIEAAIIVQAAFRGYLIRARMKREAINAHLHHVRAARQMTRARLSDLRYMRGLALEDNDEACTNENAEGEGDEGGDDKDPRHSQGSRSSSGSGGDHSNDDSSEEDDDDGREHLGPPSMRGSSFSGYVSPQPGVVDAKLAQDRRASVDTALMLQQRASRMEAGQRPSGQLRGPGGNGLWERSNDFNVDSGSGGGTLAPGIPRPHRDRMQSSVQHYRMSVGPGCSPRNLVLHAGMSAAGAEAGQGYWHVQAPAGAEPGAKGDASHGAKGRPVSVQGRSVSGQARPSSAMKRETNQRASDASIPTLPDATWKEQDAPPQVQAGVAGT